MKLTVSLLLLACAPAYTQTPPPQPKPSPAKTASTAPPETKPPSPLPKVLSVKNANLEDGDSARLTNRIYVSVSNLDPWLKPDDKITSVILYLDARPLPSVKADPVGPPVDSVRTLAFDLARGGDPQELEAWRRILISARRASPESVSLSVGLPGRDPIASDVRLKLKRAPGGYQALVIIGLVLAVGSVLVLAWKSDLLRDTGPAPIAGRRTYSLGRTQMAIWFCLVLIGWASISLVNTTAASLSNSVLMLMGISATTGLAAVAVDVQKGSKDTQRQSIQRDIDALVKELDGAAGTPGLRATVLAARAQSPAAVPPNLAALEVDLAEKESRLRRLAAQAQTTPPPAPSPSVNWIVDILSDENGISFHRLQMFLWTLALGVYFCISVFKDLVMPEFDNQLLILMGISSGTYLGFKLPEK